MTVHLQALIMQTILLLLMVVMVAVLACIVLHRVIWMTMRMAVSTTDPMADSIQDHAHDSSSEETRCRSKFVPRFANRCLEGRHGLAGEDLNKTDI